MRGLKRSNSVSIALRYLEINEYRRFNLVVKNVTTISKRTLCYIVDGGSAVYDAVLSKKRIWLFDYLCNTGPSTCGQPTNVRFEILRRISRIRVWNVAILLWYVALRFGDNRNDRRLTFFDDDLLKKKKNAKIQSQNGKSQKPTEKKNCTNNGRIVRVPLNSYRF